MKSLSSKDKKGILLIVISFVILLFMFFLVGWLKHKSDYDKKTFCPNNIGYDTSVVIIDKSDRWKDRDAKKLVNLILNTSAVLKQYERLQIKVIHSHESDNTALIDTFFDFCNPGSKANPLYQNPRKIINAYKQQFERPLQEVTKILTRPGYADSTPLFRAIQEAVVNSQSKKIKLTIVSDLFEFSEDYNFYKNTPDIKALVRDFNLADKGLDKIDVKYIRRKKHSVALVRKVSHIFEKIALELNASYSQETFMVTNESNFTSKKNNKNSDRGTNKKTSIRPKKNKESANQKKKGRSESSRSSVELEMEKAARIILKTK